MNPPGILGLPLGIWVIGLAVALTLFGLSLVRRARSQVDVMVALVCFALPAIILIFVGPAVILIILNLNV